MTDTHGKTKYDGQIHIIKILIILHDKMNYFVMVYIFAKPSNTINLTLIKLKKVKIAIKISSTMFDTNGGIRGMLKLG